MHIPSTAREQVAAIKAGTLTAETLMAATYDRMEAVNGTLNAVVSVLPREEAMARARAADAKPNDGPLHGLPLAVKDLANAAGFPTTQGAPFFAEMTPVEDDLVIARLRGAGAVVFGKTNSPEFGLGSHTTNRLFGPTRNPYDPTRSAGGSSGGAGVALASGIVSIADGSDMMGSLRNPAVWNGVFGIRPTVGRVPRDPVGEAFLATLSTLGPMARDPLDLALLLDVMSGPDPRVPDAQPLDPVLPKLDAPLSKLRLGWVGDWGGAWTMEHGLLAAYEGALSGFGACGHGVDPIAPPMSREVLWQSWTHLRAMLVHGGLSPLVAAGHTLNGQADQELAKAKTLTVDDILAASAIRSDWFRCLAGLWEKFDALILPAAQVRPYDVTQTWPSEINGVEMDTYHRWMECVIPASLAGVPAIALPAGLDQGLPFGFQVLAAPGREDLLIRLAMEWHQFGRMPAPDMSGYAQIKPG